MLFSETRRSKRYIALLPVIIDSMDIHGNRVAESLPGRIIDLSKHGASLFLTRVMINQYHIFFSVQENREHLLHISLKYHHTGEDVSYNHDQPQTDKGANIILKARPVWMDNYDYQDLVAFKMGVEFTERPSRSEISILKQAMKKQLAII